MTKEVVSVYIKDDNIYSEMRKNSAVQWLTDLTSSDDVVNKHGAKLTLEHIEALNKKIKELEDKNALKDEFLKRLKQKVNNR